MQVPRELQRLEHFGAAFPRQSEHEVDEQRNTKLLTILGDALDLAHVLSLADDLVDDPPTSTLSGDGHERRASAQR